MATADEARPELAESIRKIHEDLVEAVQAGVPTSEAQVAEWEPDPSRLRDAVGDMVREWSELDRDFPGAQTSATTTAKKPPTSAS